jgi:ABC-type polysaccharide/polyol phosphate transport system ATPase subunit
LSLIVVENAWKKFKIPHERPPGVFSRIARVLSLFESSRYRYEDLWALKGISFELARGESLGIIGPNGSGKSTLLKVMAGVIKLDKGRVITNGSPVAVLELGIGFHPDLTVKENALIYGIVMGITRREIKKKIEPILEFSDLTKFQDAKLKTLSSGMQVRLAFSIAVQTRADLYLIDEALAVGDAAFQEKCLNAFREFKKEGRSIVLVSHGMDLIRGFCENGLYLKGGELRYFGASDEAVRRYLNEIDGVSG